MKPVVHLTDEELARFDARPLKGEAARHLKSCPLCEQRLADFNVAAAAYIEYRDTIRAPLLPAPPTPWRSLSGLIAEHERSHPKKIFHWWPGALAAVCALVLAVVVLPRRQDQNSVHLSDLLRRSVSQTRSDGGMISMRIKGRMLVRPAVLTSDEGGQADPDMVHVRTMFISARYNWRAPLNAQSFQAWRNGLARRSDSVSVVRQDGRERAYRIRTDTAAGILRSASLTLRAGDLHPVNGGFQFEGESAVEMEELPSSDLPAPEPVAVKSTSAAEAPATPADTLRVLAALSEMGADTGEPISVSLNPITHRVSVRAMGLTPQRQEQLTEVLRPLPRVDVDVVHAGVSGTPAVPASGAEKYSAGVPEAIRQRFEDRFGGAAATQAMTDQALDAGSAILAHAHAIDVLRENIPPETEARLAPNERELLLRLRQRHVVALKRLSAQITQQLAPLLNDYPDARLSPLSPTIGGRWQDHVSMLTASAQESDRLMNRLLAGSYSQTEAEPMLRQLASVLKRLEWSIDSQ